MHLKTCKDVGVRIKIYVNSLDYHIAIAQQAENVEILQNKEKRHIILTIPTPLAQKDVQKMK